MFGLRTGFAALAIAGLVATTGTCQLAGAYLIDNTLPTGGGIYNTFQDAAADLIAQGVAGPTQFLVQNGSGPYAGMLITTPITGASASNTISFEADFGQTPVIGSVAPGAVQGIRLGASNSALNGGPKYISFSGLTVTGIAAGAGIMAVGCEFITVQSCTVTSCGTGIYFGFTPNSVIQDCSVSTCANTPGTPGSSTYVGGISLYNLSNTCLVQRNRVFDCTGNGIFVGGPGGTSGQVNDATIINNFVWNTPGLGSYPGGIALRRASNSTCCNNTIVMPPGTNFAGINIMVSTSAAVLAPANVSNNVIQTQSLTGACIRFDTNSATMAVPVIFDYNLYDNAGGGPVAQVVSVNHTLASWQALVIPPVFGKELNTLNTAAGLISTTDLHITPSSAAFNSGSFVAVVADDIDGDARPIGVPDRGADETQATGLFASFTASTATTGPAPFSVTFADSTFTSDPSGVQTWGWDFENDGIIDSNLQNPTFLYAVPGVYSVSLTVTDLANPQDTYTRTNYITVQPYVFDAFTTGGGVGDLTITGVPIAGMNGGVEGYMFVSFDTSLAVGAGPFFGLVPDFYTWTIASSPAGFGNLTHWYAAPGFFPDVPFSVGPGALAVFAGMSIDFIQVDLTPFLTLANVSNPDRITF